jgi:hypothetical protein
LDLASGLFGGKYRERRGSKWQFRMEDTHNTSLTGELRRGTGLSSIVDPCISAIPVDQAYLPPLRWTEEGLFRCDA